MRGHIPAAFVWLICSVTALGQDRALTTTRPAPVPSASDPVMGTGFTPAAVAVGGGLSGPSSSGGTLYDNGAADGGGAYSNVTIDVFGARRTLLDDFTVPPAQTWAVNGLAWTHVWGQGQAPPFGTGAEFDLRDDAGGAPGAVFTTTAVTTYDEVPTGNLFFSRPEAASVATFDPVVLGGGTYWFDGTVVGADNNFWLSRGTVSGSECWVDYDDLGGLQSGTSQFGVASDLNFQILGELTGEEGCEIYDNGDADGSGGASNATAAVFGARRTLLDDFTVPVGESWNLTSITWSHIWNVAPAGSGTGAEFDFRADAGGAPGSVFATAAITAYTEVASGDVYFSRPEAVSTAEFLTIPVGSGTTWFDGTIVGADNNFWLIRSTVSGSEFWVDYEDQGGLQPGSAMFGVRADLNFKLGVDTIGTGYCHALPNSTGLPGRIYATGSSAVTDNNVILLACDLPPNENGYLLNSPFPHSVPVGNGILCVGGGIGRHTSLLANSGPAGHIKSVIDLNALPRPMGNYVVQPGEKWHFTLWHRDGSRSNFTDAVRLNFQ